MALLSCCCSQTAAAATLAQWRVVVVSFVCVCVDANAPTDHKRAHTRERERESARGFLAWALSHSVGALPLAFCIGICCGAFLLTHTHAHTEAGLCWILFVDASADGQQPLLSLFLPLPVHAAHVALDCDDSYFLIALLLLPLLLLPLLFAACGCCCCCSA